MSVFIYVVYRILLHYRARTCQSLATVEIKTNVKIKGNFIFKKGITWKILKYFYINIARYHLK